MERSVRFNDQQSCVRAWAHQQCMHGHSSHLFFEGATIFSYGMHFPIATLFGSVVFVNHGKYSATTSCHQSLVKAEINHKQVIPVHVLPVDSDPRQDRSFQERNVDYWLREIRACLQELYLHPKRRSLEQQIRQYQYYITQFMQLLGITPAKPFASILEAMDAKKISAFLRREVTGRLFAAARKATNPQQYFLRQLAAWEKGLLPVVSYAECPAELTDIAYLRLNTDTNRIETSKEIQMPVALAYRCWRSVQDHIAQEQYDCNIPLLSYHVSKITPDHIIINCHTIPIKQLKKIAKQLGWQYPPGTITPA